MGWRSAGSLEAGRPMLTLAAERLRTLSGLFTLYVKSKQCKQYGGKRRLQFPPEPATVARQA